MQGGRHSLKLTEVVEKFDGSNYIVWKHQMLSYLRYMKLDHHILEDAVEDAEDFEDLGDCGDAENFEPPKHPKHEGEVRDYTGDNTGRVITPDIKEGTPGSQGKMQGSEMAGKSDKAAEGGPKLVILTKEKYEENIRNAVDEGRAQRAKLMEKEIEEVVASRVKAISLRPKSVTGSHTPTSHTPKTLHTAHKMNQAWREDDFYVKTLLTARMTEQMVLLYIKYQYARQIWTAMEKIHERNAITNQMSIKKRLDETKMTRSQPLQSHFDKMEKLRE
jgi:hypothetical protein